MIEESPQGFDHEHFLKHLSSEPGVYRMYDLKGEVIYVGKAKNLKKRVGSYFRKTVDSVKTQTLVKNIVNIDVTIVSSETEAFLLENNYIKKYRPRYNVVLRDDKSYPFILISEHEHPRLSFHRGPKKRKGEYFVRIQALGQWEKVYAQCKKYFLYANVRIATIAHAQDPACNIKWNAAVHLVLKDL